MRAGSRTSEVTGALAGGRRPVATARTDRRMGVLSPWTVLATTHGWSTKSVVLPGFPGRWSTLKARLRRARTGVGAVTASVVVAAPLQGVPLVWVSWVHV